MCKETEYEFNPDKNIKLKQERGVSFEEIIYYINNGALLDTIEHPNKEGCGSRRDSVSNFVS
jgi:hypothetical protein